MEKKQRLITCDDDLKDHHGKTSWQKLQSKHGNKYSVEQYHALAQLIHIGKQESYDKPPNFPFLWEENMMAIRVVPMFMVQKLLHILPLLPVLQVVLLIQYYKCISHIYRKTHKYAHRVHLTTTTTGRVISLMISMKKFKVLFLMTFTSFDY